MVDTVGLTIVEEVTAAAVAPPVEVEAKAAPPGAADGALMGAVMALEETGAAPTADPEPTGACVGGTTGPWG